MLTNPVYIGSSVNGGLPFPDWLNPLTKDIVKHFTPKKNFDPLYASGCAAGQPTWGIYVKGSETPAPVGPIVDPPFLVGGQGKDFSTPKGYELADVFTLQSKKFVDFYNDYLLTDISGQKVKGCCVFMTYDGFLTVGGKPTSYVGPYGSNGKFACEETLKNPVYLGTDPSGQYKNEFYDTLNATTVAKFWPADSVSKSLCTDVSNTFAIYMLSDETARNAILTKSTMKKSFASKKVSSVVRRTSTTRK